MKPALCVACGCDEDHACHDEWAPIKNCWWLRFDAATRTGVCSCCEDAVALFDKGEREPQLHLIVERFYRQVMFVYGDEASAVAWMHAPHPLLGGRSARDCILAGRLEHVRVIVDQLRSGAFA